MLSTILTLSLHVLLFLCQYSLALSLSLSLIHNTHAGGLPGDLTCKVTLEETQVMLRDCRQADIGRQNTDTQTKTQTDKQREIERKRKRESSNTYARTYKYVYMFTHTHTTRTNALRDKRRWIAAINSYDIFM
jgi:hypothetical protein